MRLKDKSIVVTGASSGMGKAIVERFVKEGAFVVAVARRKERLDALKESLAQEKGQVLVFQGDVSKKEDNEKMIELAVPGIMDDMSGIGDATDEKYEQVMKVNVYGPMCAMRKAVSVFKEQGHGNIINVASVGGMRTAAGAIYCASKAALLAMTRNTAFMYIPDHIRCNAIAPGGIQTEIANSMGMPNPHSLERRKILRLLHSFWPAMNHSISMGIP